MRVFSIVFLFLVLVFLDSPGRADDAKPFDLKILNAPVDEYSVDLTKMHDFMKSHQEKEQKIELLNLDLQEAKIEVELREKRAALGKSVQFNDNSSKTDLKSNNSGDNNKLKTQAVLDVGNEVKSIFITKSSKEAVLNVDGGELTVKEGDKVGDSIVKEITSNAVTLVNGNNEITKLAIK